MKYKYLYHISSLLLTYQPEVPIAFYRLAAPWISALLSASHAMATTSPAKGLAAPWIPASEKTCIRVNYILLLSHREQLL
jgi:hypothetical protein